MYLLCLCLFISVALLSPTRSVSLCSPCSYSELLISPSGDKLGETSIGFFCANSKLVTFGKYEVFDWQLGVSVGGLLESCIVWFMIFLRYLLISLFNSGIVYSFGLTPIADMAFACVLLLLIYAS